ATGAAMDVAQVFTVAHVDAGADAPSRKRVGPAASTTPFDVRSSPSGPSAARSTHTKRPRSTAPSRPTRVTRARASVWNASDARVAALAPPALALRCFAEASVPAAARVCRGALG